MKANVLVDNPVCEIPFAADWELPNGFSSTEYGSDMPVPVPDNIGHEKLSFENLGEGSGFFDFQGILHSPLMVKGRVLSEQPYLLLRILTEGRSRVAVPGRGVSDESTQTYSLFTHSVGADCAIENKPGEINSLIGPMLSVERLRLMLEGQKVPALIGKFLNGHTDDFIATPKQSPTMRRIVGEIRSSPYEGAMRSLHLQGKIFELMAEVLCDLDGTKKSIGRTLSADRRRALAARDILMADLAHPPGIDDLARRVGLSQKRLGEVFRDLYGASVFQCLTQWRLEMARDLLCDNELAIKQIAHKMGYAHTNNFILAFSRRFGSPPARYRKNGPHVG